MALPERYQLAFRSRIVKTSDVPDLVCITNAEYVFVDFCDNPEFSVVRDVIPAHVYDHAARKLVSLDGTADSKGIIPHGPLLRQFEDAIGAFPYLDEQMRSRLKIYFAAAFH